MIEVKKFIQIFICLFVVIFALLNLGTVKRIFNYKLAYGGPAALETPLATQSEQETLFPEKENSIEIPRIKIIAPLVFVTSSQKSVFAEALDRGVAHWPDSVLPGEEGQTVFLGHSAPLGWPKIKHDWVFSDLGDLVSGDEIVLYFNHQKYTYYVRDKVILEKGTDLPENTNDELVLLTCWPPGADVRRMAVLASLY